MTTVLLVYDRLVEDVLFYKLAVRDDILEKLKQCHNKFSGTDDSNHLVDIWLPAFLENIEPLDLTSPPTDIMADVLIYTGFV